MNTGRRRSSDTTPRKCGALPEKLVKSEKTPEKDGETPEKRGEPVFDDAVGRAAAWAEPLTRRRKIQGDEIIVPEGLDTLDGCFLRKLCEIVRCFHGRFVPPNK